MGIRSDSRTAICFGTECVISSFWMAGVRSFEIPVNLVATSLDSCPRWFNTCADYAAGEGVTLSLSVCLGGKLS